jgi:peptidoglycan/xylan/chitin deacetylase (PgdA/CDA1 family)
MHGAGKLLNKIIRIMILLVMYPFARLCQSNAIPILAYHSVDNNLMCPYSVSVGKFWRQIEYLRNKGYHSISLHDLISYVQGRSETAPRRGILLSFDDGYTDFCLHALPVLRQYGFRAVLSVVGDFCEKGITDWDNNGYRVPALTWGELLGISDERVEIGSHGIRHGELTSIPLEQADFEIWKSKEIIEGNLDRKVSLFCYPHGACNDVIANLVKRNGYEAGMTTNPGLVKQGDDLFRLRRVTIEQDFSLMEYKVMLTPVAGWYFNLRNRVMCRQRVAR